MITPRSIVGADAVFSPITMYSKRSLEAHVVLGIPAIANGNGDNNHIVLMPKVVVTITGFLCKDDSCRGGHNGGGTNGNFPNGGPLP